MSTAPFGCSATCSNWRAASSERRRAATKPDEQQRGVAEAGEVGLRRPALRLPCLIDGAGGEDVEQFGGHQRRGLHGWGAVGAADAFPDGDHPGVRGRVRGVAEPGGEPDRGQPPAHGADPGAVPGEVGEVAGDRRRPGRQRLQAVLGAPGGELRPVAAVAAQGVRGPGGGDVAGLRPGQRHLVEQVQRVVPRHRRHPGRRGRLPRLECRFPLELGIGSVADLGVVQVHWDFVGSLVSSMLRISRWRVRVRCCQLISGSWTV